MPNLPFNRLIALLLTLQTKINAAMSAGNRTRYTFRYHRRLLNEVKGMINAINTQFPGTVSVEKFKRYQGDLPALIQIVKTEINRLVDEASSASSVSTASSITNTASTASSNSSSSSSDTLSSNSSRSSPSSASPSSAST